MYVYIVNQLPLYLYPSTFDLRTSSCLLLSASCFLWPSSGVLLLCSTSVYLWLLAFGLCHLSFVLTPVFCLETTESLDPYSTVHRPPSPLTHRRVYWPDTNPPGSLSPAPRPPWISTMILCPFSWPMASRLYPCFYISRPDRARDVSPYTLAESHHSSDIPLPSRSSPYTPLHPRNVLSQS